MFSGNPEQATAYESSGNCVVLAGPGSGKTYTLTHKLAKVLREDVLPPRRTACITYNKQCVRDLKRKLHSLGLREGNRVSIGTVHSFCLKHIILPFAHLAGVGISSPFIVGTDNDINALKQQAYDNCGINDQWRPNIDSYRRVYIDRNSDGWREQNKEAAMVIEEFERLLLENGIVDFDWMMLTGLKMVQENEWIRKLLAAQFPVVFVDEYQDLGVVLHEMVKVLCVQAGIRIVAVGDPDQSIYGFSGARPELIKELSDLMGFETVRLKLNYRCGNAIIKASEVALGEVRGCTAYSGEQGLIFFHHFPPSLREQASNICSEIIPEILSRNSSMNIGDIGVFYLDRFDGDVVAEEVSKQGWDYIRVDGNSPYQPSAVTYWLEDCAAWCAGGWQKGDPSFSGIIRQWVLFNDFLSSDAEIRSVRASLVEYLYANRTPDIPLHIWLEGILDCCVMKTLESESRLSDDKLKVTRLLEVAKPGHPLSKFTVASFGGQGRSPNHLNLTTLHSAKGLEFDVVIMVGLEEGRIPWSSDGAGALREKRRLFYVGLTRAKSEVHLVFSGQYTDRWGFHNNGPSRFVREVHRSIQEQESFS
ncbi:ATP-dependent helicase [Desulfocurvus sp. DL9XJH121]